MTSEDGRDHTKFKKLRKDVLALDRLDVENAVKRISKAMRSFWEVASPSEWAELVETVEGCIRDQAGKLAKRVGGEEVENDGSPAPDPVWSEGNAGAEG